jgi:hypothetical protein
MPGSEPAFQLDITLGLFPLAFLKQLPAISPSLLNSIDSVHFGKLYRTVSYLMLENN